MGCTFESGGMSHTIIELRIVPLANVTPFLATTLWLPQRLTSLSLVTHEQDVCLISQADRLSLVH
jgi:hypothetical protein